jgi:4-hydroxy-2-oxoheptanedioate aldolase
MMHDAITESALARLRQREPVFGIMQTLPSPHVTEAALQAGFDFVMLDCEHGIVDEAVHRAAVRLIGSSGAFSAVRVMPHDLAAVRRYLDWGVDVVLMPDVRNAAAASAFAECAGHDADALMFAMIESGDGAASASAIAATQGIAGLVIGPHDLAAELGVPKEFTAPRFKRAVKTVEAAAHRAGALLGGGAYGGFPIEQLVASGHTFILAGSDIAALTPGFRAQFDATRLHLKPKRT